VNAGAYGESILMGQQLTLQKLPGDRFINRKWDLLSRFNAPKRRKLAMLLINL